MGGIWRRRCWGWSRDGWVDDGGGYDEMYHVLNQKNQCIYNINQYYQYYQILSNTINTICMYKIPICMYSVWKPIHYSHIDIVHIHHTIIEWLSLRQRRPPHLQEHRRTFIGHRSPSSLQQKIHPLRGTDGTDVNLRRLKRVFGNPSVQGLTTRDTNRITNPFEGSDFEDVHGDGWMGRGSLDSCAGDGAEGEEEFLSAGHGLCHLCARFEHSGKRRFPRCGWRVRRQVSWPKGVVLETLQEERFGHSLCTGSLKETLCEESGDIVRCVVLSIHPFHTPSNHRFIITSIHIHITCIRVVFVVVLSCQIQNTCDAVGIDVTGNIILRHGHLFFRQTLFLHLEQQNGLVCMLLIDNGGSSDKRRERMVWRT